MCDAHIAASLLPFADAAALAWAWTPTAPLPACPLFKPMATLLRTMLHCAFPADSWLSFTPVLHMRWRVNIPYLCVKLARQNTRGHDYC